MVIMPNPEVYADVSVHIGDLWRSLPWTIIGKENSTTDMCMRTWTQSTGQLGHGGGNNKWHKQTLCRDQKAIMRECFHTGHRTWSELPHRLDVSPLSLSLILLFLRVSKPVKETWQVLSGFSPKQGISGLTTGRLSAIQPLSQSYHTSPAGMQNPGPAGG